MKLLDQWGRPVEKRILTEEVSAASIGSVRTPVTGYPADGLTPDRLAGILRAADTGDAIQYLELAEAIEERDLHYSGVLGTRKRSVSQIGFSIEDASDDPLQVKMAERVREWLRRDELTDEVFDILDAVGKGYSHTEIIWDTSEGQWSPARLEYRDPRWFRFDRRDLTTPIMLSEHGQEMPYPAFKFIFARMKAKSGLPLRSGIARLAVWSWMFKAYTQRDWAIFTQTYGQPIRIGRYGQGASAEDRNTLFRAVANIGGDCAAIIPESMRIEFVESGNVGSSTDHYESRCNWLDKQVSKAILGQTSTTDAEVGGLGSGKEHREVQKDIETADANALAAILNRDLIRPWMQLEFGPQRDYPRLKIERPEPEDLKAFTDAVTPLVDRGLRVSTSSVLSKFGLKEAAEGESVLSPVAGKTASEAPPVTSAPSDGAEDMAGSAVKYPFNTPTPSARPTVAAQAQEGSAGHSEPFDPSVVRLASEAAPLVGKMVEQIEAMMEAAGDLDELHAMLTHAFPDIPISDLADVLGAAQTAAAAGGRAAIEDDARD